MRIVIFFFAMMALATVNAQTKNVPHKGGDSESILQKRQDAEQLEHALEYFTSGKYHESLLIFHKLEENYKLNDRYRAYIALGYYYEWDYENAQKYFDEILPRLSMLSPKELSVYYYAAAESHFYLHNYHEALTYLEYVLTNGYNRDKGDAYYRMGFCYYLLAEESEMKGDTSTTIHLRASARDKLSAAASFYRQYRNISELSARLSQIEKMCNGLSAYLRRQSTKEEDPSQTE